MLDKPSITIRATGSLAILQRGANVEGSIWQSARSWWSSVAVEGAIENEIWVPIGDFLARKQWLLTYWRDLGRELVIDPGFRIAMASTESQIELFKELAQTGYSIGNPQLTSHLKLNRPLTAEQITNITNLVRSPSGANFSVPGAGKTATSLAIYKLLREGEQTQLLVVCPKSSFEAWQTEASVLFGTDVKSHIFDDSSIAFGSNVLLVNYEQLENAKKLTRLKNWMKSEATMLVLDEAHRVKGGAASVRWRACKALANFASRVDLLTGTPMPQGYSDLRNLLMLSWPMLPKDLLTDQFLRKVQAGGLFVRTTKSQLNLPPIDIQRVRIPMGPVHKDIYAGLLRSYDGLFATTSTNADSLRKKGRAILTLIAAATNPGLVYGRDRESAFLDLVWPPRGLDANMELGDVIQDYVRYEMPEKYLWLRTYLESHRKDGRKVLVWSSFVGNLLALNRVLKNLNPALIHGGLTSEERISELNKFRTDPTCLVLITNPQTLGEGISLHHDCHEAVFVDRTFNAGQYLQALDRIHRLGLGAGINTRTLILESEESIDSVVGERLDLKISRLARMLDDASLVQMSLPDDENTDLDLSGFEVADLDAIFGHLKEIEGMPI